MKKSQHNTPQMCSIRFQIRFIFGWPLVSVQNPSELPFKISIEYIYYIGVIADTKAYGLRDFY